MKYDINRYKVLFKPFNNFINKRKSFLAAGAIVSEFAALTHLDLIHCYLIYSHLTGEDVSNYIKDVKEYYGIKD